MSNDYGVSEGQVLAGKYQVERVLGRGGMGFVVAARHIKLNDRVALKFLLPHAASAPDVVTRFAREARAAVRIRSEHVARVTDVGELEDGSPYMVMEYLEGVDLSHLLRQNQPLPIADSVEFILQACEAIAEAHALGIVHRDLKPANLFLAKRVDGSACIKVLDFGISKVSSLGGAPVDATLTGTQSIMGSPQYMSPEQMMSTKQVDERADIWALGAILYELFTGRAAFIGETLGHLAILIAQQAPRPMREARAEIEPALEAIVLRCLEKDRVRRFANVAELANALAEFGPVRARISAERVSRVLSAARRDAVQSSLPPPPPSDAAPTGTRPSNTRTDVAWGKQTTGTITRRRTPLVAGIALTALAAIVIGWFASRRTTLAAEPVASSISSPTTTATTVAAAPQVLARDSNEAPTAATSVVSPIDSANAAARSPTPAAPTLPAIPIQAKLTPPSHPPTAPVASAARSASTTTKAPPIAANPGVATAKPAANFDWGDRP